MKTSVFTQRYTNNWRQAVSAALTAIGLLSAKDGNNRHPPRESRN